MENRTYIAIDLKSFYASEECVARGLDPLTTNLVVADAERTEKTICLAVSPSLKAYGISGRARLFEVVQQVRQANAERKRKAPGHTFTGKSYLAPELAANPALELDYITAQPRMLRYIDRSAEIFKVYLKYIAPEDINSYSIDEVFIDATPYLATYKMTPRELAMKMILDVLATTGITATAGIGTNLYLAKVAMDIGAKHIPADKNGVRIAELDEISYRENLWTHKPITDFWRVGHGYAKKLADNGMYTMGDVARCSIGQPGDFHNEDLLYKLFGVNAELLDNHAWGWEPVGIADIKAYKPEASSVGSGQVLQSPYPADKARLIAQEMADLLVLDLVDKGLVTNQVVLTVGYDIENLKTPALQNGYQGEVKTDHYGRKVPKSAHGTQNLGRYTSSTKLIVGAVLELYDHIVDENLLVRRVNLVAGNVLYEDDVPADVPEQLDLFTDPAVAEQEKAKEDAELAREREKQKAILKIQKKYGKNAILKGANFEEGAMTKERNKQVGGHKA